jgi:hypothetical protein
VIQIVQVENLQVDTVRPDLAELAEPVHHLGGRGPRGGSAWVGGRRGLVAGEGGQALDVVGHGEGVEGAELG